MNNSSSDLGDLELRLDRIASFVQSEALNNRSELLSTRKRLSTLLRWTFVLCLAIGIALVFMVFGVIVVPDEQSVFYLAWELTTNFLLGLSTEFIGLGIAVGVIELALQRFAQQESKHLDKNRTLEEIHGELTAIRYLLRQKSKIG
jgi:hypothetical protein